MDPEVSTTASELEYRFQIGIGYLIEGSDVA